MKYPASMMIGGRMTVKNSCVLNSMISWLSLAKNVMIPSTTPITMSRQLSGKRFSNGSQEWNAENNSSDQRSETSADNCAAA